MILEKPSNWTLLQDFKRQVCREISRVAPLKDAELKDLKKVAAGEMTSGVWSCLRIAELVHVDECVDIMKQPQVTKIAIFLNVWEMILISIPFRAI